jgi:hypothetical protein
MKFGSSLLEIAIRKIFFIHSSYLIWKRAAFLIFIFNQITIKKTVL